ncbi:GNAT family N-acetyltransferase [Paenirhodobacter populi]|uniref:N-acetyltransferase n=1 Tax=Paenirhodobacter populi TaxID=2306993 RepID=A0A451GC53_9RHOB|nr:GNAT family N-acetyltransferase [Sinirhodobacter populi]RWR12765.1 N-acetyltransferase [Sinirhodobacter populi]
MGDVFLRPGRDGDRAAIARIWHDSAGFAGAPSLPPIDWLRQRVDALSGKVWQVTVAEDAGGIVAFVAIEPDRATLSELFVRPDRIGTGLGAKLLGHARAQMPGGFTLYTWAGNAAARRFYERAGLVPTHEGRHPERGHPVVHYAWKPPVSSCADG